MTMQLISSLKLQIVTFIMSKTLGTCNEELSNVKMLKMVQASAFMAHIPI